MFEEVGEKRNGVIVHSDLLLKYLEINYPKLYFVSSTTKVLTDFNEFLQEVKKEDFRYVVPDFRLNKACFRSRRKIKWNFYAMNAVGLDVKTESNATK